MRAAAVAIVLLLAAGWARWDYRRWRALGVGGLPPTWRGWLRTTRWRMMKRNPLDVWALEQRHDRTGAAPILATLPAREGRRPRVAPYPVPHRQLTDHAPAAVRDALAAVFDRRVARDPTHLVFARSHFEKHNQAVTVRSDFCCHADAHATHGEVAHIHPSDGSMHMVLAAGDAAIVVQRGWGELHGLAGIALGLPPTYTLVYAPRDPAELAAVATILDAAVAFMLPSRTAVQPPA